MEDVDLRGKNFNLCEFCADKDCASKPIDERKWFSIKGERVNKCEYFRQKPFSEIITTPDGKSRLDDDEFLAHFVETMDRVELLCKAMPELTTSYPKLFFNYLWYFYNLRKFMTKEAFLQFLQQDIPNQESIDRAYRKLHELGKIKEDEETTQRRMEKERQYRDNMPKVK